LTSQRKSWVIQGENAAMFSLGQLRDLSFDFDSTAFVPYY